ncbi:MAG: hypothetical protein ABEJ78_01625 [Haloferacaceae archaeon]
MELSTWEKRIGTAIFIILLFGLIPLADFRLTLHKFVKSYGFDSLFSVLILLLIMFLVLLAAISWILELVGKEPTIPYLQPDCIIDFPVYGTILLCATLAVPLVISETISTEVNHQIYGLIFDGFGAALLGYEGTIMRWNGPLSGVPREFWGLIYLIGGFALQILHLMPWHALAQVCV